VTGLVTLALLYMTVLSVLGRRKLPGGMDSVALPFAGLFALPSVRSVMPGGPPFGVLFPSSPSHFVLTLTFRLSHRYDNQLRVRCIFRSLTGYHEIDFIGIIPNLAIIAGCVSKPHSVA